MEIQKSPMGVACDIVGSQAEMARILDLSPAMVNQMVKRARPVPAEHCKSVERFTNGLISVQMLRPDDWKKIWPELVKRKQAKPDEPWDGVSRRFFVRRKADGDRVSADAKLA